MIHLVLDCRVIGRKLLHGKLRFQGMGTEGTQPYGQGGKEGSEEDKENVHCSTLSTMSSPATGSFSCGFRNDLTTLTVRAIVVKGITNQSIT